MHEHFMAEALNEARASLDLDEFPVGAVVVFDGEIVARARGSGLSRRERRADRGVVARKPRPRAEPYVGTRRSLP